MALLPAHVPALPCSCLCLQAARLPTTNGPWAQGEGLELAREAGASLLHLDRVQVHPTGFVDPADPASGTKVCSAFLRQSSACCMPAYLQVTAAGASWPTCRLETPTVVCVTCLHRSFWRRRSCVGWAASC